MYRGGRELLLFLFFCFQSFGDELAAPETGATRIGPAAAQRAQFFCRVADRSKGEAFGLRPVIQNPVQWNILPGAENTRRNLVRAHTALAGFVAELL